MSREYNFDGLVGPTHNYAGLSSGNLASMDHKGQVSNPKKAALEGIRKMRHVVGLGVGQAILPPHYRPHIPSLRALGFTGSNQQVLAQAAKDGGHLLRLCSSASAMWTANAATVAPSADTEDGRLHLSPANLTAMFHRSIEGETQFRILSRIFADPEHFEVHRPLPGGSHFSDEGAANHTRLFTEAGAVELFAWGREGFADGSTTRRFPARQTREASQAIVRRHRLKQDIALLWQQHPAGIDAGSFHTDVLATGHEGFMMFHALAFADLPQLLDALRDRLGHAFRFVVASEEELPVADAIAAYPFNSQIVSRPGGAMTIVAPRESQEKASVRRFLERVVDEPGPIEDVDYIDVNASMHNGGGPACLRLRVTLEDNQVQALSGRVIADAPLLDELEAWVKRHYRDRLAFADLSDPALLTEVETALDELTGILKLGSVYEFQG